MGYGYTYVNHRQSIDSHTIFSWTGSDSVPPGREENYSVGTSMPRRYERWRSGGNTPDYHSRVRQGLPLPVNNLSLDERKSTLTFSASKTSISRDRWMGLQTSYVHHFGTSSYFPDLVSLVDPNEVYMKARLKLKDENTWNAPLFFAELGKTVQMISGTATALANAALAWKAGSFRGVFRALDRNLPPGRHTDRGMTAANKWLAWKYGVTPTVLDMYSFLETVSRLIQESYQHGFQNSLFARVKRSTDVKQEHIIEWSPRIAAAMRGPASDEYRFSASYKITNPQQYALARFGITNPAEALYEMVKWSSVVDWFIPIGDWISSFDAGIGIEFENSSLSRKQQVWLAAVPVQNEDWDSVTVHGDGERTVVSRMVTNGLPMAGLGALTISPGLLISKGNGAPTLAGERLTSALAFLKQAASKV